MGCSAGRICISKQVSHDDDDDIWGLSFENNCSKTQRSMKKIKLKILMYNMVLVMISLCIFE